MGLPTWYVCDSLVSERAPRQVVLQSRPNRQRVRALEDPWLVVGERSRDWRGGDQSRFCAQPSSQVFAAMTTTWHNRCLLPISWLA